VREDSIAHFRPDKPTSHDQNFKNLLLDYLQQALAFFAATEADAIETAHIRDSTHYTRAPRAVSRTPRRALSGASMYRYG